MCSGLPALPDSQEPWTAPPPSGLGTALLTVGTGGSPALLRGFSLCSCPLQKKEQSDWRQQPGQGMRERLACPAGRL